MKRFTETTKWADPWFRKLSPTAKLLWLWLCDCCDSSGVIDFDDELASFQIGGQVTTDDLKYFSGRVEKLNNGKLIISKFLKFQYGKLSSDCKAHIPVFRAIESNGLTLDDSLSIAYPKAIHSLQEEEEETDKEADQEKEADKTRAGAKNLPSTPQAVRIAALFSRRPTTAWSEKESKALRAIGEIHDDDLALIEAYYAAERAKGDIGWHRRDIGTFLNNFSGELDRARAHNANAGKGRQRPGEYPETIMGKIITI
jgi:hypothetical protein